MLNCSCENGGIFQMDTKLIAQSERFFVKQTFQYFQEGLTAYERQDYHSAAVWGAVFIEALLKDILTELGIAHENEDLNGLVSKVKNSDKHVELDKAERSRYKDIAGRCTEIRIKRNRIVHDTGTGKGDIQADAADIYDNNLDHILKQYFATRAAEQIEKKSEQQNVAKVKSGADSGYPVFISTITPHSFEQQWFLETFCNKLRNIGIDPRRCEFTDYDNKNPAGKVCRDISKCKAVIVIGLERSHAYFFMDKEGSPKETEGTHRFYSSSWLQMESGIAIGLGKPVFVLCRDCIHSDGIFDRSWNSYTVLEMDGPLNVDHPKVELLLSELVNYMRENP